jgi:RNA polymerase sigma-70 factor (ECF subfamily)
MQQILNRDVSAFEHLYDGYHRLVYGIAVRMTADSTTAEDLTQSVFMKIWSSPELFRGGNLTAWLARVTRNRCLDHLRSNAAKPMDELPLDLRVDGEMDDGVLLQLDAERVRKALAVLPPEQRAPIEMGFFGGATHEEIARKTNIPLGTIKTRIRNGLRRMRSSLEEAAR